jgi:S1-C subfamily serine protease
VIGSRDGDVYVLTAAHVVSPTGKLLVETFTAASRLKPDSFHKGGQLVFRNVEADLAVIRFPAGKRDWTVVRIGSPGREVRVESGWAIGCDDGAPPRITAVTLKGKKLVRRPDGGSAFYWQADGKSVPGRSGGPLFDRSGQLIGICSGTQDG